MVRRYGWDNCNRDRTKLIIHRGTEFAQQRAEQIYQKVARNSEAVLRSELDCYIACALTKENTGLSLAQRYAWDVHQTKSCLVPGNSAEEICSLPTRQEQNPSPSWVPWRGEWGETMIFHERKYQKRYSQSMDPSKQHAPKIWASWSKLWSVHILKNLNIAEADPSHTGIQSLPSPS